MEQDGPELKALWTKILSAGELGGVFLFIFLVNRGIMWVQSSGPSASSVPLITPFEHTGAAAKIFN